jgi:hypothetical protein
VSKAILMGVANRVGFRPKIKGEFAKKPMNLPLPSHLASKESNSDVGWKEIAGKTGW